MSHNVPAVSDVFAAAIKKPRSGFSSRKNVAEKNRTKGVARLRFFVAPPRRGEQIQSCYVPFFRTLFLVLYIFPINPFIFWSPFPSRIRFFIFYWHSHYSTNIFSDNFLIPSFLIFISSID